MNKLFTIRISLIVALGGFLLGFDSAVISGTITGIRTYFEMSDWELGFAVGCVIFGAMFGNIAAGPASDRFGRKPILIVTALLFTVSAAWSALATSYPEFIIARIIGGVGIGAAILIAPIYIAEIAPPKQRGSLVSLNQLNIVIGISIAYFSNYFLKDIEVDSWRWMLGVEIVPALFYFVTLFTVPESPRWLINRKNKTDKAQKILARIGGKEYAETTTQEIINHKNLNIEKGTYADFFSKKMNTILIIAFGLAFFQQITGINAIFYYAPTIFEQAGGSTDSSFLQAIVVGLTNLAFTFVAIWLIDKLGRKPLLIIGTASMSVALFLATLAFNNATYHFNEENISKVDQNEIQIALKMLDGTTYFSQTALYQGIETVLTPEQTKVFKTSYAKNFIKINAIQVLFAILLYVAAFAISLGPVMWTMLSEIFPNNVKGIAISIVGFFNSLISYSVTQLFPWELSNLGPTLTFAIYTILAILSLLFVMKYITETKGKTLEELEDLLIKKS
ncbi:MAG: sugar porter family MFS transporter [Flavobacteriaceae bacterium]|nr:sugar porter family MFS transporter [Flavobacteriaceae bacterium]